MSDTEERRLYPFVTKTLVIPISMDATWNKALISVNPANWEMTDDCTNEKVDSFYIDIDAICMPDDENLRIDFQFQLETCDGQKNWRFSKKNPLVNLHDHKPIDYPLLGIEEDSVDVSGNSLSFSSEGISGEDFVTEGFRFHCEEQVMVWKESPNGKKGSWKSEWVSRYSPDPRIIIVRTR